MATKAKQSEKFSVLFQKSYDTTKSLWKPAVLGGLLFMALTVPFQIMSSVITETDSEDPGMLLSLLMLFLLQMLISYASQLYFLSLGLEHHKKVHVTLRRIIPICGVLAVWLWAFCRSFAWLAIIGFIMIVASDALGVDAIALLGVLLILLGIALAIAIMPRLQLSSAIYIREKKGIMQSVDLSYTRTKGYWGKIVGNYLLLLLVMIGILVVVGLLALAIAFVGAMLFQTAGPLAGIAVAAPLGVVLAVGAMLLLFLIQVFPAVFLGFLTDTITKHPRK